MVRLACLLRSTGASPPRLEPKTTPVEDNCLEPSAPKCKVQDASCGTHDGPRSSVSASCQRHEHKLKMSSDLRRAHTTRHKACVYSGKRQLERPIEGVSTWSSPGRS